MSVLRARGPQCENEADLEVDGLDLISSLEQDDPRLIRIIQNWFLEPIPDPGVPYKFSVDPPVIEGQIGVPGIVDTLLNKKQNGFYIGEGSGHWERLAMWCTRLLQDLGTRVRCPFQNVFSWEPFLAYYVQSTHLRKKTKKKGPDSASSASSAA